MCITMSEIKHLPGRERQKGTDSKPCLYALYTTNSQNTEVR